MKNAMVVCKSCFVTSAVHGIEIDSTGQCNICRYYRSEKGKSDIKNALSINRLEELKEIAKQIKADAKVRGCKYDCILGASGGFDSTYVIYIAKKILGLNPLVVKYDNGVCHPLSNENLKKTCNATELVCSDWHDKQTGTGRRLQLYE